MTEHLLRPGSAPGSTVLFLAGGRPWTADDAVRNAAARGALDRAIAETLAMIAAEDDVEVDEDALQDAADKFRYDHDLISAGETEEWLAAHGLTLDDFATWLNAQLCAAESFSAPADDDVPDDFTERLLAHLWFSGAMEKVAEEFRRRIASQIELASEDLAPDAAHARIVGRLLNAAARGRKLEVLRLPLTRIEVDWLDVDSEAAAREATLCVRNDRATLAEVARDAGFATKRERMWAEDAGRKLTPQAMFGSDGELIGPLRIENGYRLCQVVQRIEPSLEDRDVAARVDSMLLDEFFNDLCARHTQLPIVSRASR